MTTEKPKTSINNIHHIFDGSYFSGWLGQKIPLRNSDPLNSLVLEMYEAALEADPTNTSLIDTLGHAYTRKGLYQKGLEMDLRLCKLDPENQLAWYNLACSYSLLSRIEDGIDALEKAISLGYRDFEYLMIDSDLNNLQNHPRFKSLLQQKL